MGRFVADSKCMAWLSWARRISAAGDRPKTLANRCSKLRRETVTATGTSSTVIVLWARPLDELHSVGHDEVIDRSGIGRTAGRDSGRGDQYVEGWRGRSFDQRGQERRGFVANSGRSGIHSRQRRGDLADIVIVGYEHAHLFGDEQIGPRTSLGQQVPELGIPAQDGHRLGKAASHRPKWGNSDQVWSPNAAAGFRIDVTRVAPFGESLDEARAEETVGTVRLIAEAGIGKMAIALLNQVLRRELADRRLRSEVTRTAAPRHFAPGNVHARGPKDAILFASRRVVNEAITPGPSPTIRRCKRSLIPRGSTNTDQGPWFRRY